MAALVNPVIVNELGVCLLGPALRRLIELAWKDCYGRWDGDILDVEERDLVFPVETRGRHAGVRQPVEGDIVEDIVSREFGGGVPVPRRRARGGGERCDRLGVTATVIYEPSSQPDRGI